MKDKIQVGKILNTHGIKGEIKVLPLTNDITRFNDLSEVYIEGQVDDFSIERVWYKGNYVIIKFKNYDNINDVLKFRNKYILIDEVNTIKLPEDTFFIYQLIGLSVFNTKRVSLGNIIEVLQPGANDIYVVSNGEKEYLIPAIKEVVKSVDLDKKEVIIDPIEGMIE